MTVNRTLTLRLYPSKKQKRAFEIHLECCRIVYNQSLEYSIKHYKETKESMSFFDLNKNLTEMIGERTELKEAYRQCLTESVHRLHKAYQAFFRRLKKGEAPGFPRFKGKDRIRSFTYTHRSQYSLLKDKKRLKLGKIGEVHFKGSIPSHYEWGVPKTCTIKRSSTGKWFATIVYEFDCLQSGCELFREKTKVGIDLNIKNLATLSDGTVYPNHRLIEKSQEQIA